MRQKTRMRSGYGAVGGDGRSVRGRSVLGGVLGVCAIGVVTAPVTGQTDEPTYPPLEWVATEQLHAHPNADDQAVDIGFWQEDSTSYWVYACGWVTELDEEDEVIGTRMAVYRYDATEEGPGEPMWQDRAFFPPYKPGLPGHVNLVEGDSYKAVAMVVDYLYGEVFVLGEGPSQPGGTDQDYILIKYDEELNPVWVGDNGARYYDGPAGGDDIPADLHVYYGPTGIDYIVVTGSSPGSTSGLDIATLAFDETGDPADLWPDVGWGDGVRRYDYTGGDDKGVEVGHIDIASDANNDPILTATVLGTSWGGSTTKNDYTVHLWTGGSAPKWDARYDNGANDVATGMTDLGGKLYATGYSEQPSSGFGGGGPALDIDYATVSYSYTLEDYEDRWAGAERLDYDSHDYARDIVVSVPASGPNTVWVTGAGGDGTDFDVLSVRYLDDHSTGVTDTWWEAWAGGSGWQYARSAALWGETSEPWDSGNEPYIVGAIGSSTSDRMLAVKYEAVTGSPPFDEDWYKTYYGTATYTSGVNHEGRRAVVRTIGSDVVTFIAGVSSDSGEGKQFTVWRYTE